MLPTACSYNGMVVTPHRLASQAGLEVLREGGNAVEAAIAAAAALCVVYPHMTGLGGDGFWLILPAPGQKSSTPEVTPLFIDGCGRAAQALSQEWYTSRGFEAIPKRGPGAALTMAGAVSGWHEALAEASGWTKRDCPPLPLSRLFADAVAYAEEGYPVTRSQSEMTAANMGELAPQPGFADTYLVAGKAPAQGERLRLPLLARTLRRLAKDGLEDFYTGALSRELAEDLAAVGSPLSLADFGAHRAQVRPPLRLQLSGAQLFNSPPPTQGVASLMILGLLERYIARVKPDLHDDGILIHSLVEATKQAFMQRDRFVGDPDTMAFPAQELLDASRLDTLAAAMDPERALPWPQAPAGGDTIWMGVMDRYGNTVSLIQSIFHEFGSGLVLPRSGLSWHNRGLSFVFDAASPNCLAPGKKPFHTLNPAIALLDDGRTLSYGTMGGEGQPQTQAAVFTRYFLLKHALQDAVSAPRWLLGRAWGDPSTSLKIEENVSPPVIERLRQMGHVIEMVPPLSSLMGHAGALVRHSDGLLEGAFDPRSDGAACCW